MTTRYRTKRYDYAIWLTKHFRTKHQREFVPEHEDVIGVNGQKHRYWYFPEREECEEVLLQMPPYLPAILNAVKVLKYKE